MTFLNNPKMSAAYHTCKCGSIFHSLDNGQGLCLICNCRLCGDCRPRFIRNGCMQCGCLKPDEVDESNVETYRCKEHDCYCHCNMDCTCGADHDSDCHCSPFGIVCVCGVCRSNPVTDGQLVQFVLDKYNMSKLELIRACREGQGEGDVQPSP